MIAIRSCSIFAGSLSCGEVQPRRDPRDVEIDDDAFADPETAAAEHDARGLATDVPGNAHSAAIDAGI